MDISLRLTAIAYIIRECIGGRYKMQPADDLCADSAMENAMRKPVTVADIGCDHGYLGIYLCERDILESGRVLACDLREGPLKIAEGNIAGSGFSDRIETRLSDGLEKIEPGEADIITINGMGGELIFDILKRGEQVIKKAEYAVVSPQSKIPAFRYCMKRCGIDIIHEEVVYDVGKYYHIMVLSDLDKADFSGMSVFEDPGITGISYEDYSGKVVAPVIYTEELLKKRKLLIEAKKRIEEGLCIEADDAGTVDDDVQTHNDSKVKEDKKIENRALERLREIDIEIEYIDRILS